ncbi:MAG: anthranilate synthase component I [Betaproteobacteria bacterium]|nr:anthranilate synthase component I [Betaproteobacteria bacterium]
MTDFSESDFDRLAKQGYNRIPVVAESRADLDTPVGLYLKLANSPWTYLLESVVGGERFGRYSYIGLPATERIEARGEDLSVHTRGADGEERVQRFPGTDPFVFVRDYLKKYRAAPLPGLPRFAGGLVGYFGYETVRFIEKRLAGVAKPDPLGTPDVLLMRSEELAVVDNVQGKLYFVVYADPAQPDALRRARSRLNELQARLARPVHHVQRSYPGDGTVSSSFTQEGFLDAVKRTKEYIYAGDAMQIQISQRFSRRFTAPPFALYRSLRGLNPSPYMFYFDLGDHHVVGASPEILVRLEGDTVTLRPIAGTRPRGKTADEDKRTAAELLADPKERAEHVMLIDLGRNDVGRVSRIGSVKVTDTMVIERYSHVMHIVSNCEGKLADGLDAFDVLKATFPAGTVTGAPKVRAMEIIDEFEPIKRGIYSGAAGYLGFNGDMDLAIAIRTAVVKDGTLHVQAAAGVVADSDPQSEYNETLHKSRAVLRAAEMALAETAQPVAG